MKRIVMCVVMAVGLMAGPVWGEDQNDPNNQDQNQSVMILNPNSGEMSPGVKLGEGGATLDVTTGRVIVPTAPAGPSTVIDLSGEDEK